MKLKIGKTLTAILFVVSTQVNASAYLVPSSNESLIGNLQYGFASSGDTAITMAKRYDIGLNSMKKANPHLDAGRGFPTGARVLVPSQHLLPNLPRQGIVINLPEMRMYYYLQGTNKVLTYPIGIGKVGKTIPIVKASITKKTVNPIWIPPDDIREFNLGQGIVLPKVMPPGPDNPLGPYAIYTSIPTYLIHSTIFPESIGTRASFGCIRMYESDIKQFFPSIISGTPIEIINTPIKVAWQNKHLYTEAYHPLEEHGSAYNASLPGMVHTIADMTRNQPVLVDWQAVSYVAQERDGVPHEIGVKIQ